MERVKVKGVSKGDLPGKSGSIKNEKNSNTKKNIEKRSAEQNTKKYAVISPESVVHFAESVGISELSEEVTSGLAEDISYKLREVVHSCCTLLHNNKRQKLLTDDVNRVFETSNTPVVYGHSVSHGVDFVHVPKADVFVEHDTEVDIVTMSLLVTAFIRPGEEYAKGTWLLPDIVEKPDAAGASGQKDIKEEPSTSKQEPTPSTPSTSQATKPPSSGPPRPGEPVALSKPPIHFINYYLQVARVVIGGSEPHLRGALADLRTNSKISPVVPYFLNLVALSVNKLQRNGWLTDALLRTIEALVDNPHVDPSSQLAVNRAVNALLVVAIEPKSAKKSDDLLLRKRAAHLLAKVLVCWSIELKQQMDIVRQLLQLLLDGTISLKSHYGAVVSLTALGQRTLDSYFWPILDRYITVLEEQKTSPADAHDVQFVKGAIMIAVERMYKRKRNIVSSDDIKRRQKVEQKLYEFLGDSLVPRYNLRTTAGSVYPGTQLLLADNNKSPCDHGARRAESFFTTCTHGVPSAFVFKPEVRNAMPKLHMYSVFSLSPYAFKEPKEIIFNFVGSNQKNSLQLKRRKIGDFLQKDYKSHHYKFAQIWRFQKVLRKTRSIKYCSPSHTRSNVGDLFGVI